MENMYVIMRATTLSEMTGTLLVVARQKMGSGKSY